VRHLASLEDVYWLAIVQGIADSAQGWMNCILFCITTRKIREKFMEFVECCFCCRKKQINISIHFKEIAGIPLSGLQLK